MRTLLGFSAGLATFILFKRGVATRLKSGFALPTTALLAVLAMPVGLGIWFDIACVVVAFPAITLIAASAVLGPRTTVAADWLGWISYPLYATHFPLAMVVIEPLFQSLPGAVSDNFIIFLVVLLGILFTVAGIAGRADEAVRNWLTEKWRGSRIARPVAMASERS